MPLIKAVTVYPTPETRHKFFFWPKVLKTLFRLAVELINCKAFSKAFCQYRMFGFDDFLAITMSPVVVV